MTPQQTPQSDIVSLEDSAIHSMEIDESGKTHNLKRLRGAASDTPLNKRRILEYERPPLGKRKLSGRGDPGEKLRKLTNKQSDYGLPPLTDQLALPAPGDELQPKTWIMTKYFGPGNQISGDVRDIATYGPEQFAMRHDKDIAQAEKLHNLSRKRDTIFQANQTFAKRMEKWWKGLRIPTATDAAYYYAYKAAIGSGAMNWYTSRFAKDFGKEVETRLRGLKKEK